MSITLSPEDSVCKDARIAISNAASVPLRAREAEKRFIGKAVDDDLLAEAPSHVGNNQNRGHQGIATALYEEFKIDNGLTLNPNFVDYKRPRAWEAPFTKVIHVITNDPYGPFGAKEASEGSCCAAPPAIIDAIHNATGVWIKELPAQPEKIYWALKKKREKGFQGLPEFTPSVETGALRNVLLEVAERMKDNYPYPHPMYIGQMIKPPHPIARLAYALTL